MPIRDPLLGAEPLHHPVVQLDEVRQHAPSARRTNRCPVQPKRASTTASQSAAHAGVRDIGHGDGDGGARRGDGQRGAADDRARPGDNPRPASVWVVNAFQFAVTVSLLPLSALGDGLGYRRVYWPRARRLHPGVPRLRACADASRPDSCARHPGVRRSGNHERQYRARPVHLSFVHGSARASARLRWSWRCARPAARPSLQAILSVASWRWLFLINVPIGALALVMAARTLPGHAAFKAQSRSRGASSSTR